MKINFKNSSLVKAIAIPALLLASCSDFGDTNVNPNSTKTPLTSALLTEAITGVPPTTATGALLDGIGGRLTVGATEPTLYAQYLSQSQYPESSLYATTFASWDRYYGVALQDLQSIIDYNSDPSTKAIVAAQGSNNNQLAVARILKAYMFWVTTDRWGDIPYTEALKKKTEVRYDRQQDIYTNLFVELKEAKGQFDAGPALSGDILLNGNKAHWKKFANSLRMLMALRISKVDPAKAKTEFLDAFNDADGYISSNAENVFVKFLDDNKFRSPWNALFDGRDDYGVSDFLIEKLKGLNDPRISQYAAKNEGGEYLGLPYGFSRDLLLQWTGENDYSRPSEKMLAKTFPGYIITAAQMNLARAEAAILGWTSENRQTAYNEAIRASFEQWEVFAQAAYDAYIMQSDVSITSLTDAQALAKIGEQRWIALFPNGQEAWFEWRRTGFPDLVPTPNAVNESKQIPRRYAYPVTELTLNKVGYEEAVGRMSGGDKHITRVWWDVQ